MTVVAITGGTGFLGAATVARFRSIPGATLRILSRAPLAGAAPEELVIGDIEDRDACQRLVAGADAVVHSAGLLRSTDVVALHRINVEGTQQVVRAARAAGVSRFVHVSSSGVYGHPGHQVHEGGQYLAATEYERSKAYAEQILTQEWHGGGLVVVQPSNIIGAGHPLRPLRRFLTQIAAGRPFVHAGGWSNYVGVDDVARVLVTATTVNDVPPMIIVNVPLRLGDLVVLAQSAVRRNVRTIELPGVVGRILEPALFAASRRVSAVDRMASLFAATSFVTVHGAWFEHHELTPDLGSVLREMAVSYGIGGEP